MLDRKFYLTPKWPAKIELLVGLADNTDKDSLGKRRPTGKTGNHL